MKTEKLTLFMLVLSSIVLLTLIILTVVVLCVLPQTQKDTSKGAYEIWLDNGHTGTQADFLDWLKGETGEQGTNGQDGQNGQDGKSAYEIFLEHYPYYTGTEEQWVTAVATGELHVCTVTFKSEVADDIVVHVLQGYDLTDIPPVPEKEGQETAAWDRTAFTNVTENFTVNAVYTMKPLSVRFHNEYTDDADVVKTVPYDGTLMDIPAITPKVGNSAKWSVDDFSNITKDMQVEAIYETVGLKITFNSKANYTVEYLGSMSNETQELFIPTEYKGLPVVGIEEHAFQDCTNLTTVIIPEGISYIAAGAFKYATNLATVKLPSSITQIGSYAFGFCDSLSSIILSDDIQTISPLAFYNSGLTKITIPNNMQSLQVSTFGKCTQLTSLVFGNNIKIILENVFEGCYNLEKVFFKGTKADFDNISVNSTGNEYFLNATVYFYSEMTPPLTEDGTAYDGNYWHYDTDGVTPVIWTKN